MHSRNDSSRNYNGFSLVELSIVLVILGLLTGGILGGQSLIRAAELRAVSTEHARYATAVGTFRDKYFSIPGDFRDATRFWTRLRATTDCVTNSSAAVSTPGTCDGNGSGTLETTAASESEEIFQFWRQLALAGLIEGTYTGLATSVGIWDAVAGSNVPASKMGGSSWGAATFSGGNTDLYTLDYGNLLNFGKPSSGGASGPILKPEEAWNIDTKMDDGKPATGKVVARYWNNLCSAPDSGAAANTNLNASYRLTDTAIQCALYFRHAF